MASTGDKGFSSHSAYLPLKEAHTRVVRIRPGTNSDPLHLEIIEVDLNDLVPRLRHQYWALSYTWGDNYGFVRIEIICQVGCGHTVAITDSARSALQCLRSASTHVDIWIDQLSIDQSNNTEKASQIALMKTIYERAAKVVIWLGPVGDESEKAFEHIGIAHNKVWSMWQTNPSGPYEPGTDHLSIDNLRGLLGNSLDDINAWKAVKRLVQRKWFTRAWVVQEATALAEVDTDFVCGSKTLPRWVLHTLRDIFFAVEVRTLGLEYSFLRGTQALFDPLLSMLTFGLARNRLPGGRPILNLLSMIRPFNATDPRDKIFSMLNFACDVDLAHFPIDYDKSVEQVYTDFVIWYLSRSGNLDFLSHAGMHQSIGDESPLPSWIPDWSRPLPVTAFSMLADPEVATSASIYAASGPLARLRVENHTPESRPRILSIVGIRVSSLDSLVLSSDDTNTLEGTRGSFSVDAEALRFQLDDNRMSLEELLTRTVFADCNRISLREGWISERIKNMTAQLNLFQFRRTIGGRALFITGSSGTSTKQPQRLLVLCPKHAEPGDDVWMLRGGRVFYVMRRVSGDVVGIEGNHIVKARSEIDRDVGKRKKHIVHHKFIGEAYIHGLMDGELLAYVGSNPAEQTPPALAALERDWREIFIM